ELVDLLAPTGHLRVGVLTIRRAGHRGVGEEFQVELIELDHLVVSATVVKGHLVDPLPDAGAEPAVAGAADDDANLHEFSFMVADPRAQQVEPSINSPAADLSGASVPGHES